jgi:hypothetical protein
MGKHQWVNVQRAVPCPNPMMKDKAQPGCSDPVIADQCSCREKAFYRGNIT